MLLEQNFRFLLDSIDSCKWFNNIHNNQKSIRMAYHKNSARTHGNRKYIKCDNGLSQILASYICWCYWMLMFWMMLLFQEVLQYQDGENPVMRKVFELYMLLIQTNQSEAVHKHTFAALRLFVGRVGLAHTLTSLAFCFWKHSSVKKHSWIDIINLYTSLTSCIGLYFYSVHSRNLSNRFKLNFIFLQLTLPLFLHFLCKCASNGRLVCHMAFYDSCLNLCKIFYLLSMLFHSARSEIDSNLKFSLCFYVLHFYLF